MVAVDAYGRVRIAHRDGMGINELARTINEPSLDLDQVFRTALRGIDRIVKHNGACLSLLDERTGAALKRVLSPPPKGTSPGGGDSLLAGMEAEAEKELLG